MVRDVNGRMRGCAPMPGYVASGPTGTGSWVRAAATDTDLICM